MYLQLQSTKQSGSLPNEYTHTQCMHDYSTFIDQQITIVDFLFRNFILLINNEILFVYLLYHWIRLVLICWFCKKNLVQLWNSISNLGGGAMEGGIRKVGEFAYVRHIIRITIDCDKTIRLKTLSNQTWEKKRKRNAKSAIH